jgi:hypothetical protein
MVFEVETLDKKKVSNMLIESDWLNVLLDTGEDKGHLIQVHQV